MVNSEPISFPIQIGLEVLQELEYFLQQSKALALFMGGASLWEALALFTC